MINLSIIKNQENSIVFLKLISKEDIEKAKISGIFD